MTTPARNRGSLCSVGYPADIGAGDLAAAIRSKLSYIVWGHTIIAGLGHIEKGWVIIISQRFVPREIVA